MATRGPGGLERLVQGNAWGRAVHGSGMPVLLVRGDARLPVEEAMGVGGK